MKIILLFSLLFLASCGKESSEDLPGTKLPISGIVKTLPVIKAESFDPGNKFLSAKFNQELDLLLGEELISVDSLSLYQNGESLAPIMNMISHSKKFFYMNLLSFTCDESSERIVAALENKAHANVDVRLIINKGFSLLSHSCLKRLERSGVKILKVKTHSSYFINDEQELLIGSQSVARMFLNSNGFNSLDRDMMIYSKGDIATSALFDFTSIWLEEGPFDEALFNVYKAYRPHLKKKSKYNLGCRFIAQRPKLGTKNIELLWDKLISNNQKEIYFSGVKVDIGEGRLGKLLKEKSNEGMDINYIGNGYLSGNGEFSMVLDEWIADLKKGAFSFLSPVVEGLNIWDKRRVALESKKLYDLLLANSKVNIWNYFNFIHYKVWLFDGPSFFVGSANLDESKFNEVYDSGLYCQDLVVYGQLKSELLRDKNNSVIYRGHK